jgi:hypothetical protein
VPTYFWGSNVIVIERYWGDFSQKVHLSRTSSLLAATLRSAYHGTGLSDFLLFYSNVLPRRLGPAFPLDFAGPLIWGTAGSEVK